MNTSQTASWVGLMELPVTDQFGKRCQITPVQVERFSDDELASHFSLSGVLPKEG